MSVGVSSTCVSSLVRTGLGDGEVIEANRRTRKWAAPDRSTARLGFLRFFHGDHPAGIRSALGPSFTLHFPGAVVRFRRLQFQDRPLSGFPMIGNLGL